MPLAREVAAELRTLADALDKADQTIELTRPDLTFWAGSIKQDFLNAVAVLPRPLVKHWPEGSNQYDMVTVSHDLPALRIRAQAWRGTVCRIVRPAIPAEFECEPLLSQEEEASLA